MAFWNNSRELTAKLSALDKSQAVIEFAMDGTILTANANFLSAMGYALSEVRGRHHSMFVEPAFAKSPEYAEFWKRLRLGEYQACEYKRLAKGGREVWIQASYNPILGRNGQPHKVVKFATDITQRKLADADFKGQVDAIGKAQAVIHFNLDGTIIEANQNFLDAMGYRVEEIAGKHHSMFVDPDFAKSPEYRAFWERLGRGEYEAREYKRLAKGGREVWIQASYNPIFDMNGKPFKVVKFATDITKQKLTSADSSGQIDAIGKAQAVIHFNLDGTIIDANDNFLNTVGYRRDEIAGKHHSMFVDPAYAKSSEYRLFWEKLRSGIHDANEYRRLGKGNREIWIQASYNPIFDMNGKPFKVVKFATDITRSMTARLQVAELIEKSTANVQGVASGAEEMSASIREINGNMLKSKEAVEEIVSRVNIAGKSSDNLKKSSEAMNRIVDLIRDIAGRVNLLALNATIEAARAGEAGKGFTVVASEVKNLAGQTAAATDNISSEIAQMLTVSTSVAATVGEAVSSAQQVARYVNAVASALEQQNAAMSEISGNAQNASHALGDINQHVKEIAAR